MRKTKFFVFSLLVFTGLTSSPAHAVCDQPVNSKKVVLFIDFNAAEQEMLAAERAACARGEAFEVIPSRKAVVEVGRVYGHFLQIYETRGSYCYGSSPNSAYREKRCALLDKEVSKATLAYKTTRAKYSDVKNNLDAVKKKVAELEKNKRQLSSIVVSGHHGGMGFYGDVFEGELNVLELLGLNQTYPTVFKNLHSFMGWGCTSVSPFTVTQMKAVLPGLKVIAGYINSGPLSIRPKSSQYLEDILNKEAVLSSTQNESALKAAINGVNRIQETFAGVYVGNSCGNDYFYSIRATETDRDDEGNTSGISTERSFGTLKSQMTCEEFNENYWRRMQNFQEYLSGSKAIPPSSDGTSDLRMDYLFFRDFQHCLTAQNLPLNYSDRVGLLLFYSGVQANFAKVFSGQLREADRELQSNTSETWAKKFGVWDEAQTQEDLKLQTQIKALEDTKKQKIAELPPFTDVDLTYQALLKAEYKLKPEVLRALQRKGDTTPLVEKLRGNSLKKENSYLKAKEESIKAQELRDQKIKTASLECDQKIAEIREQRKVKIGEKDRIKQLQGEFLKLVQNQGKSLLPEGKKLTDLSRKEMIHISARIDLIANHSALASHGTEAPEYKSLRALKSKMQRYLVDLDPECMGFLDWHADQEGRTPKPLCE